LHVSTTEVITIEIGALSASRSFHDLIYQYFPRVDELQVVLLQFSDYRTKT
jgi:hypothetical protein